jgi:hypothetical protein
MVPNLLLASTRTCTTGLDEMEKPNSRWLQLLSLASASVRLVQLYLVSISL